MKLSRLLSVVCFSVFAQQASALPLNFYAGATSALDDPTYGTGSGGHSIWFADNTFGAQRFVFDLGSAFSRVGGTARLTGRVYQGTQQNDGSVTDQNTSNAFDVDLQFEHRGDGTAGQGTGGPKQELQPGAYSENGGPIDTNTWSYLDLTGGTLTGAEDLTGVLLHLTQRPSDGQYPFQAGDGANGKNLDTGLSGWFGWESTCEDDVEHIGCNTKGAGDVNITLTDRPSEVPAPASIALLGLGLFGLRWTRNNNN